MGLGWEGKLYSPGSVIDRVEPLIVLECAGPVGPARGHKRAEILWLLWQYRQESWHELARSLAINYEWTEDLRGPAIRALYPVPALVDIIRAGREIAEEIISVIDERLERKDADLRRSTLSAVYDRVAARIVG